MPSLPPTHDSPLPDEPKSVCHVVLGKFPWQFIFYLHPGDFILGFSVCVCIVVLRHVCTVYMQGCFTQRAPFTGRDAATSDSLHPRVQVHGCFTQRENLSTVYRKICSNISQLTSAGVFSRLQVPLSMMTLASLLSECINYVFVQNFVIHSC